MSGPSRGKQTFSPFLVPFIHSVANRISDITNEAPVGRGNRPSSHFTFQYDHFPVRTATDPQEYDFLVNEYALFFVNQNVTRASIYTDYCSSTGHIGRTVQERLTDPNAPLSYVKGFSNHNFKRLIQLSLLQ
jgi:hypothetical protein